jgi:raffinose/stachyose/melibiose transport system permease protein
VSKRTKNTGRERFIRFLFILPAVGLFSVIVVIPVFSAIPYSMFRLKGFVPTEFVGLKYYGQLFTDFLASNALRNTLIYTGFNAGMTILGAIIISVCLYTIAERHLKGINFFRSVYLIPICLSSIVVALMWQQIYHPNFGLLNGLLGLLGLKSLIQPWLANAQLILFLISAVAIWQFVGFYVILIYTSFINVPADITEAAKIDGVSGIQMVTRILLPMIISTLEYTIILSLTGSAKAFDLIWVMTKGGPGSSSETISVYMFRQAFEWGNFEYGTAIGLQLFAVCAAITLISKGVFRKLSWDK